MDTEIRALIQEELLEGDTCVCCIIGSIVGKGDGKSRMISLVKNGNEHGLFFFIQKEAKLVVDVAFPISSDFQFNIVSSSGCQSDFDIPLRISTSRITLNLEIPQGDELGTYLDKLKSAVQGCSQRNQSDSSWIDRYTQVVNNPFLVDVFDPQPVVGWNEMLLSFPSGAGCPVVTDRVSNTHSTYSMNDFQDSYSSDTADGKANTNKSNFYDDDPPAARSQTPAQSESPATSKREEIVKLLLEQKQREYTITKPIIIFCGTWNVNGQNVSGSLSDWLASDPEPPDIYVVGFQELDLSQKAFIFSESPKEAEWYSRVKADLNPRAEYKKVRILRLVGMMIIVFAKEKLKVVMKDVSSASVGTGFMGMVGNKGGVAVRMELDNTTVCFVNSHLAAHTAEYERRNRDYKEVNVRCLFPNSTTILDHDVIIWLGDLNYRLSDVDDDEAKSRIAKGDLYYLLEHDQLNHQMLKKKVFHDYLEGPITFIPTYKYDPGTDHWDSSEKGRTPAWCDRILWKGHGIKQLQYRSHPSLKLSDHKPVSALFEVQIHKIEPDKKRKCYEEIMKELDKHENDFLPQVKLTVTEVQFKDVRFLAPISQTVSIMNTGQVPVVYEFINKLDEDRFCKPWLNIDPYKGKLLTKGEEVEVKFEVFVDQGTAADLTSGVDKIEDIVVLHLENGKDFFISISGNYIPSVFGSSLETLVNMYGPIRDVPVDTLVDLIHSPRIMLDKKNTHFTPTSPMPVPKEVWRLIDHIYLHGKKEENLFVNSGRQSEMQSIRDCLDTGSPRTLPGHIHSVAEALVLFLDSLPEPVVPFSFYNRCLECCGNVTLCKQTLKMFPDCHRNMFKYICAFLRELEKYKDKNKIDLNYMATMFSAILLKPPPGNKRRSSIHKEERKAAAFLYNFLLFDYDE